MQVVALSLLRDVYASRTTASLPNRALHARLREERPIVVKEVRLEDRHLPRVLRVHDSVVSLRAHVRE